jgi:hypothetical protein
MMDHGRLINSYIQMLEESFSRASTSMSSCQKSLIRIKDISETADVDKISNVEISNLKILSMLRAGAITRKVEKVFWFRFFQFSPEEIGLIRNKINLPSDRIFQILLKSWNIQLASTNLASLKELNNILPSPKFFSKWEDLGDENGLSKTSLQVGKNLLIDTGISELPFRRGSNFSLFLIALYLYNHNEGEFLEQVISNLEHDNDLFNLFPAKADVVSGMSLVNYLFIAALLRTAIGRNKDYFPNIHRNLLAVRDLPSFGDPRATPMVINWQKVQSLENQGFEDWKKSFNEEDIVFFFKELNTAIPERREFWLKYKRAANKVIVVLDKPMSKKLELKYSDDEKIFEIVKRSYMYNSGSKQDQYLVILFFNNIVVIEGSNTGFGCQIFLADDFNKKFGKSFLEKNFSHILLENSYSSFRGMSSGRKESWSHMPKDVWPKEFEIKLKDFGIFQDRITASNTSVNKNFDSSKIAAIQSSLASIAETEKIVFKTKEALLSNNIILEAKALSKQKRESETKNEDISKRPDLTPIEKEIKSSNSIILERKALEKQKRESIFKNDENKSQAPAPFGVLSDVDWIKKTLSDWGCEFIDKTSTGGEFWVLSSLSTKSVISKLQSDGFSFIHSKNGNYITNFKEAWCYNPKNDKENKIRVASVKQIEKITEILANKEAKPATPVNRVSTFNPPPSKMSILKPVNKEDIVVKNLNINHIIKIFLENKIPYIDETSKSGLLWVLSSTNTRSILSKLRGDGINFVYSAGGSHSTNNKEAWCYKIINPHIEINKGNTDTLKSLETLTEAKLSAKDILELFRKSGCIVLDKISSDGCICVSDSPEARVIIEELKKNGIFFEFVPAASRAFTNRSWYYKV